MAAPTPISALVHSSTLVTAGLYLMMRYSYVLYSSYPLMQVLLVLSLFTSFYAGVNSIFERDLKKLIALSTLRHLGFIGMAFSVGLIQLAFFHLLTHALFKSLLFMSIGDIIINLNHSQDVRYLSSGMSYTPLSCFIMYVSLLNLLGLPSLRGFFSKDLVLEAINYSSRSAICLVFVFVNVFFTYFYTYQLFYYSFQPNKLIPYQQFHFLSPFHSFLLLAIARASLSFGFVFLRHVYCSSLFLPIPVSSKFLPLLLSVTMFISLLGFKRQLGVLSSPLHAYFSSMMYLSALIMPLASSLYLGALFPAVRSTELGALSYSVNSHVCQLALFIFNVSTKLSSVASLNSVLLGARFILPLSFIFN